VKKMKLLHLAAILAFALVLSVLFLQTAVKQEDGRQQDANVISSDSLGPILVNASLEIPNAFNASWTENERRNSLSSEWCEKLVSRQEINQLTGSEVGVGAEYSSYDEFSECGIDFYYGTKIIEKMGAGVGAEGLVIDPDDEIEILIHTSTSLSRVGVDYVGYLSAKGWFERLAGNASISSDETGIWGTYWVHDVVAADNGNGENASLATDYENGKNIKSVKAVILLNPHTLLNINLKFLDSNSTKTVFERAKNFAAMLSQRIPVVTTQESFKAFDKLRDIDCTDIISIGQLKGILNREVSLAGSRRQLSQINCGFYVAPKGGSPNQSMTFYFSVQNSRYYERINQSAWISWQTVGNHGSVNQYGGELLYARHHLSYSGDFMEKNIEILQAVNKNLQKAGVEDIYVLLPLPVS